MKSDPLVEQATRAAWLYYERALNQEEIARRMAVSRSTISRLLSHARETGIVEISINRPLPEVTDLETALYERFSFQVVEVEPRETDETPVRATARAGARFLNRRARAGGVMGIGWGTTLRAAAQQVTRAPARELTLVDVVGRPPAEDPLVGVSRLLALAWSVEAAPIPAPAFAATHRMRDDLLQNPVVERALNRAKGADIVVASVGGTDPRSTLVKEGVVSAQRMQKLRSAGAVGDLLGHFYDHSGREMRATGLVSPIGLDLEDLRAARLVVAIAAGKQKVEGIRAAADAGLIGGLVTDAATAKALLHP